MNNHIGELIEKGALVVDVRSPVEFKEGSNPQSINIPLEKLSKELCKFSLEKPVVVCCASGWRSQKAAQLLKRHGVREVHNACSWRNILPMDC